MMRIFGIFDRKKQIPGHLHAPNSRSSVHPANSHGQNLYSVKRAKIKELLGVATPRECREVDELLNQSCWRDPLIVEDADSINGDTADDIDWENEGVYDHGAKLRTNHRRSSVVPLAPELTPEKLAQHAPLPSPKSLLAKRGEGRDLQKPCAVDMPSAQKQCATEMPTTQKPCAIDRPAKADSAQKSANTYRQARPAKLSCAINKPQGASLLNRDLPLERTTAPHPSKIRGKKNASCVESFPLQPPCEMHYLPTPLRRTAEEVNFVAHPLPQPPLTGRAVNVGIPEYPEDKGLASMNRAASYDPPVKPYLSPKDYETIIRAVSFDPPKQMVQNPKASQCLSGGSLPVLPQAPQMIPTTAQQSQVYWTPQETPPTTPRAHAQRTPQSTPPTTPLSHFHRTPHNTPPRTPRRLALHTPQDTTPCTQAAQPPRTPQGSAPSTPRLQLHPQVLANKTQKMQPPSPKRQLPRVPYQGHNPTMPRFPPDQAHFAYSPPRSPLPGSLCPRKWVKGVILGQGTFGTVHEGYNLEDGSFFAVKVSSTEDISPEIQQEVDVLSKLDHPNIVCYLGSSIVDNRLCIFLELVRMGSLDSILRKYKRFEDHTIRNYTKQILLGLEYLHRKRTIHRDVKCANILVDVNGQVKLADFGIAKQVGESLASSVKGTPLYMAPEVLTPNEDCYSFPADIWSLGCTVLEMADGKPPWSNLEGFGFLFKVKNGELPPLPEHLSPEGRDFIQCCLSLHPKDRPTASELLQHPFVLNAVTPEPLSTRSPPPSPISPIMWPPHPETSNNTWVCGNCYPSSPNQGTAGYPRAQTLVYGR